MIAKPAFLEPASGQLVLEIGYGEDLALYTCMNVSTVVLGPVSGRPTSLVRRDCVLLPSDR